MDHHEPGDLNNLREDGWERVRGPPAAGSITLDGKGTEQRVLVVLNVDLLVKELDVEIQACPVELGKWAANIGGVLLAIGGIITIV